MIKISETLRNWLVQPAVNKMNEMEKKIMAQLEDLNAAIKAEDVDVQLIAASSTKIADDVTALLAKVQGGTPVADLTQQIQAIQSHTTALATAAKQLSDADAAANTPPQAPTTTPA